MLIELKITNFMSFKKETIFSMERSNIDRETLKDNFVSVKELNLLKSSIILGPNASGKTNLIQALHFIKWMVIRSRSFERKQKIKYFPFKLDPDYRKNRPISFSIKYLNDDNIYDYHVKIKELDDEDSEYNFVVLREELTRNGHGIFKREEKKFDLPSGPSISDNFRTVSRVILDNSLMLSAYASNDIPELKGAYDWFENKLELSLDARVSKRALIENYLHDNKFKEYLINKIAILDIGKISSIHVTEREVKYDLLKDLPEEMRDEIMFESGYLLRSYHRDYKGDAIEFDFEMEESKGTQKYIFLIGQIYDMIKRNRVLVIDELENSLHPELMKLIFQLIHGSDSKAQLIATTHSYSLLQYVNDQNGEIFRRDQIWLTRKKKDMSTQLYSLINIGGIRKDLRIFKAYFDGRLEAFPDIKLMDDDKE